MPNFLLLFCGVMFLSSSRISAQKYLEMIDSGNFPLSDIQEEASAYFKLHGTDKESGYKQWKRWEYRAQRSLTDDGFLMSPGALYEFSKAYNQSLNTTLLKRSPACTGDWTEVGPFSVQGHAEYDPGLGRITACAIDPTDPTHMIIGAETGGVWKTVDGGAHWTPLSDDISSLDVSALAMDPEDTDIYYWGVSHGLLFKSINGGLTWEEINFDGRGTIEEIVINPNNTEELWLADQTFGVFHSTDTGNTWERLTQNSCLDIALHPTDPQILYASGIGLWKSVDGGHTFEELPFPDQNNQPVLIAVSAAAPDYLYILQADGKRMEGLYLSRHAGADIAPLYTGDQNFLGYDHMGRDAGGQAPRNMALAVSDADTNIIFVAGINPWRSLDGGRTFSVVAYYSYNHPIANAGYCHADIEFLEIRHEHTYIGSDGGFYRMNVIHDPVITDTTFTNLSNGVNVRQIYRIGIADGPDEIISIGAQDNGTAFSLYNKWKHYFDGDGTETFVVRTPGQMILFASLQFGTLGYSTDTGRTAKPVVGTYTLHGSGKWITPFLKDPNDINTLYAGFDKVYRSRDLGQTAEAISQEFHPSVIAVARGNSNILYAGSASNVYRTADGGQTEWKRILYANVNTGQINDIAIHPRDPDLVAVAVTGAKNIWLTRDGGENWERWDHDLSPAAALSLAWQDDEMESIYLGTAIGVFHRDKTSSGWMPYQNGLPVVEVSEIEIREETGEIYAATYGRGIWISPLCDMSSSAAEDIQRNNLHVYPNPVKTGAEMHFSSEAVATAHMTFTLFDTEGHLVAKSAESGVSTPRLTAPSVPGVYFLRFQSKNHLSTSRIIVID